MLEEARPVPVGWASAVVHRWRERQNRGSFGDEEERAGRLRDVHGTHQIPVHAQLNADDVDVSPPAIVRPSPVVYRRYAGAEGDHEQIPLPQRCREQRRQHAEVRAPVQPLGVQARQRESVVFTLFAEPRSARTLRVMGLV
eukprot:CAMPEP_0180287902 /NCGR_PEP_ID=MMETSP0988-20121125/13691_1 /TAXON_ID=697907 /ORGANISM="non described non described, Strain CCMP2293" /LENGTH=140 /DNA_ID=CAMNT_0022262401 /DNA_START=536 /DNA_END=958 /DNA_ORIENTATION=-